MLSDKTNLLSSWFFLSRLLKLKTFFTFSFQSVNIAAEKTSLDFMLHRSDRDAQKSYFLKQL